MPRDDDPKLDLADRHLVLLRDILARHAPNDEVRAYGSRATRSGHEGSDLDLVLMDRPEDKAAATDRCRRLRAALSDSRLPILVDVHQWSQLSDTFRAEIERCYVVVQSAKAAPAFEAQR